MTIETSSHNQRFSKTIITTTIIAISLISAAVLLSFELGSAGAQKTNQSSGAAKGNMTKAGGGKSNRAGINSGPGKV